MESNLPTSFVNPAYPVDFAAERSLVSTVLATPSTLHDVISLTGGLDAFTHDAYKCVLSVLLSLDEQSIDLTYLNVVTGLKTAKKDTLLIERGIDLNELYTEASYLPYSQTAKYVRGLWVKRQTVDLASGLLVSVRQGETEERLLELAGLMASELSNSMLPNQIKGSSDYISEYLTFVNRAIQARNRLGFTGINTGLDKLNRSFGGWQNSDVILLGGRPGMGKTILGVSFAYEAALSGVPTLYISLEMKAYKLINRLAAKITGIPYASVNKGDIKPEQADAIHKAAGEIERIPLYWYDGEDRDFATLRLVILDYVRKYGVGFVVIDYVQLIQDRTIGNSNETLLQSNISRKLKQLQIKLNIPIMPLIQLNRESEKRVNKRPKLSDLRDSGQYEQDASIVALCYRPDYYALEAYDQAVTDSEQDDTVETPEQPILTGDLELIIAKNRDDFTGPVKLYIEVETNRVYDKKVIYETPTLSVPQEYNPIPKRPPASIENMLRSTWNEINQNDPLDF